MHQDRTAQSRPHLEPIISGAVGIVIIPDPQTIERARTLATELLPATAEFIISDGSLPHLTLYHGKLSSLPADSAARLLEEIRADLLHKQFTLKGISAFGGNFIFWNVDRATEDQSALTRAHEKSLAIAEFLDRQSVSKALSEEGLSLSEAELENVQRYGHPLVRAQYSPHITLGFNPGIGAAFPTGIERDCRFEVAAVELVRVGYPGRIEEILKLGC